MADNEKPKAPILPFRSPESGRKVSPLEASTRYLKHMAEAWNASKEMAEHRLEAQELRDRSGRPDPRLARLEAEVKRLREELSQVRDQRDELLAGVREALDRLSRK